MDLIDFIEAWWISIQSLAAENGITANFQRSTGQRSKHSCSLNVRQAGEEVDLVFWQTGECELGFTDADGRLVLQHFDDVRAGTELGPLLAMCLKARTPAKGAQQ